MSLAVRSNVQRVGAEPGVKGQEGSLHSEVQCIIGNGHMGTPTLPLVDRQTYMSENITLPQLRWRTVKRFEIF